MNSVSYTQCLHFKCNTTQAEVYLGFRGKPVWSKRYRIQFGFTPWVEKTQAESSTILGDYAWAIYFRSLYQEGVD